MEFSRKVEIAARIGAHVMKSFVRPRLESIIAHNGEISHHNLMTETRAAIMAERLSFQDFNAENVGCYDPIFQSGGNFKTDSNQDLLHYWCGEEYGDPSVITSQLGVTYLGARSNIARTFIVDGDTDPSHPKLTDSFQARAYRVLLNVQEVVIEGLMDGNMVSDVYIAATNVVLRQMPGLIRFLSKSFGNRIGVSGEDEFKIDACSNFEVKAGMLFNVCIAFEGVPCLSNNKKNRIFSLIVADTVLILEDKTEFEIFTWDVDDGGEVEKEGNQKPDKIEETEVPDERKEVISEGEHGEETEISGDEFGEETDSSGDEFGEETDMSEGETEMLEGGDGETEMAENEDGETEMAVEGVEIHEEILSDKDDNLSDEEDKGFLFSGRVQFLYKFGLLQTTLPDRVIPTQPGEDASTGALRDFLRVYYKDFETHGKGFNKLIAAANYCNLFEVIMLFDEDDLTGLRDLQERFASKSKGRVSPYLDEAHRQSLSSEAKNLKVALEVEDDGEHQGQLHLDLLELDDADKNSKSNEAIVWYYRSISKFNARQGKVAWNMPGFDYTPAKMLYHQEVTLLERCYGKTGIVITHPIDIVALKILKEKFLTSFKVIIDGADTQGLAEKAEVAGLEIAQI